MTEPLKMEALASTEAHVGTSVFVSLHRKKVLEQDTHLHDTHFTINVTYNKQGKLSYVIQSAPFIQILHTPDKNLRHGFLSMLPWVWSWFTQTYTSQLSCEVKNSLEFPHSHCTQPQGIGIGLFQSEQDGYQVSPLLNCCARKDRKLISKPRPSFCLAGPRKAITDFHFSSDTLYTTPGTALYNGSEKMLGMYLGQRCPFLSLQCLH